MDAQRNIETVIEAGRKIVSVSVIENRNSESKDVILVQGIIVYEIS